MKNLKLNAIERLMLTRSLPATAPLGQVPMYVRIIETLRLKEDEQEQVGWVEDPTTGSLTIRDIHTEFDIALEDTDFATLLGCANAWDGWPVTPETMALTVKLNDAAK